MEYTTDVVNEKTLKLVRRLQVQKRRTVKFVNYLESHPHAEDFRHIIPSVRECGQWLLFHNYYQIGQTRLVGANFCKRHLICGSCAIRRAGKAAKKLHDKTLHLLDTNPGSRAYYIVLTVKNGADLGERYQHLMKGWKRLNSLIRHSRAARRCVNPEKSKYAYALSSSFAGVQAGAWSFETTFNDETQEWHPHLNLLLLSDGLISKGRLIREWERITGDSFIVHVQEVERGDRWAYCEIMKYALKFSELPFEQNVQAMETLSGRRLTGTIGDFRGLDLEPDPADEILDDEPYIEILFSYVGGKYVLNEPN